MKTFLSILLLLTLSVTLTSHTPCNDTYVTQVTTYAGGYYAVAKCKVITGAEYYDFRFRNVNSGGWIQVNTMKCQYCTSVYLTPVFAAQTYEVQAKTSCSGWSASKTFTTP